MAGDLTFRKRMSVLMKERWASGKIKPRKLSEKERLAISERQRGWPSKSPERLENVRAAAVLSGKRRRGIPSPSSRERMLRLHAEGRIPVWNKGLTKDTDSRVLEKSIAWSGKNNPRCRGKQPETLHHRYNGGVRKDIGFFVRSSWEANIFRLLRWLGLKAEYEPKTFDLGRCVYRPDFHIPEHDLWIEVVGWVREKDQFQIDEFSKTHNLIVIDRAAYMELRRGLRDMVPGWE
jgi:hypothetical protein